MSGLRRTASWSVLRRMRTARGRDLHLSVSQFIREALDGLFSFDSRGWRTMVLLVRRPAFLTME